MSHLLVSLQRTEQHLHTAKSWIFTLALVSHRFFKSMSQYSAEGSQRDFKITCGNGVCAFGEGGGGRMTNHNTVDVQAMQL